MLSDIMTFTLTILLDNSGAENKQLKPKKVLNKVRKEKNVRIEK